MHIQKRSTSSISIRNLSSIKNESSTGDLSNFENSSSLASFKQNQNNYSNSDNLKVVIRIRPPLSRELEEGVPFRPIVL